MKYTTISFFDLDHTLLKVNGSFQFGVYLYKKGLIPTSKMFLLSGQYALHKLGFISPERLNNAACKTFFSGKSIRDIQNQVDCFLDEQLDNHLYFPAAKHLIQAHEAGHYTVILSSSPDFLVRPIAERLGVSEWGSTRYAVNEEGRISHISSHIDKSFYLNRLCSILQVSTKNTIAYSDSFLDLHFLQVAGTAIGVNPDRKLKKYCLANKWEIL